jgi:hypothetical protein
MVTTDNKTPKPTKAEAKAEAKAARQASKALRAAAKAPAISAISPTPTLHPGTFEPVKATPVDLRDFNGGKGHIHTATGEEYGLKIVKDDPRGKTHKLKNETHYFSGTEDDYKKNFEKK